MIMFSLFGCRRVLSGVKGEDGIGKKGKPNESDLIGFSYRFNNSIGGEDLNYRIKDGVFYYDSYADPYDELSMEIDPALLKEMKDIYLKHGAYRWNGYSKYDQNVLDGYSFSMGFSFADGESYSVHGSNCAPEGYADMEKEILALLDDMIETLKENARQEVIGQGLPGRTDSVMLNFMQRGASGSDSYEFYLYKTEREDAGNFSFRIKSVSGEYYEEGSYSFYGHLDNEYIDLSKMDELLEKYEIIRWFDYDVAAADYNNEEWFQISIGFDAEGSKPINAMGTEHPENYDAFRDECIKWMIDFYNSISDKLS